MLRTVLCSGCDPNPMKSKREGGEGGGGNQYVMLYNVYNFNDQIVMIRN